jgi:hypothetical protein
VATISTLFSVSHPLDAASSPSLRSPSLSKVPWVWGVQASARCLTVSNCAHTHSSAHIRIMRLHMQWDVSRVWGGPRLSKVWAGLQVDGV